MSDNQISAEVTSAFITECASLSKLLEEQAKAISGWDAAWYRGVPQNWRLEPKVFRKERIYSDVDVTYHDLDESNLVNSLRRKAGFFSTFPSDDIANIASLAQHLRFPTRLMDWSDHFGVALYFSTPHREAQPHIWALNPYALNALCLLIEDGADPKAISAQDLRKHGSIFADSARYVKERAEAPQKLTRREAMPVAFYPRYMHRRLAVQQAGFTIHGYQKECLAELLLQFKSDVQSQILRGFRFTPDKSQYGAWEIHQAAPSAVQIFGDEEGLFIDILRTEVWGMRRDK